MRGNTIPSPAISAIWRSQASKSTFFLWNACSQAGKIVLSIGTQLVNLKLVKMMACLEIQGPAANLKGSTDLYRGPGDFYHFHYLKITL